MCMDEVLRSTCCTIIRVGREVLESQMKFSSLDGDYFF